MTGPEDTNGNSRPISVAELLAKNGTIGAPPVGGRRRRRRGDTDSVTVAELTGEIPVIRDHEAAEVNENETTRILPPVADEQPAEPSPAPSANGVPEPTTEADEAEADEPDQPVDDYDDLADYDDDYADAVADYAAHVEDRDADVDLDFFAPPRRSVFASRRLAPTTDDAPVDSADDSPADLAGVDEADLDEADEADLDEETAVDTTDRSDDRDELPSYLRSTAGPLFGGQSVADDIARRGAALGPEDIDLGDDSDDERATSMSSFMHGAWIVGQCILAVAFGAGLFIAFDQLWKWNNIVALVLSVLVILGLVVGVRVVRKTEDIGSTLIAVAVGALVTLGPLALLQSG
jgi:hypothetical protein